MTLFRCVPTFLRTYATRPKCGEWICRWLYDAAMGGWRPGINYYRLRGLWARLISWKIEKEKRKEKEKYEKEKEKKRKEKKNNKKRNYIWEEVKHKRYCSQWSICQLHQKTRCRGKKIYRSEWRKWSVSTLRVSISIEPSVFHSLDRVVGGNVNTPMNVRRGSVEGTWSQHCLGVYLKIRWV